LPIKKISHYFQQNIEKGIVFSPTILYNVVCSPHNKGDEALDQSLKQSVRDLTRRVRKLNHLLNDKGGIETYYRTMIGNGYTQEVAEQLSQVDGKQLKVATLRFWVTTYGWNRPAREGNKEAIGVA
jgi:hypothetical protein